MARLVFALAVVSYATTRIPTICRWIDTNGFDDEIIETFPELVSSWRIRRQAKKGCGGTRVIWQLQRTESGTEMTEMNSWQQRYSLSD